jgi:FkbM family methyltransferase
MEIARSIFLHAKFRNTYQDRSLNQKAIMRLLGEEPLVIFEIGAADGLDTQKFLKELKHPDSRIYCFEPDQRRIAEFKKNIDDPRAILIESAVGAWNGSVTLNISSTKYSSSIKSPNVRLLNSQWPEMRFLATDEVRITTLDSAMAEFGLAKIDFIWADVQGAEGDLITGGVVALERCRFFYSEYSESEFYVGALDFAGLSKKLGSTWRLMKDYKTDALFENSNRGPK